MKNHIRPVVSAVILAAGKAERFGKTKQLAAFGDRTLLEHAIDNYVKSSVSEIILVLGYRYDEIAGRLNNPLLKIVHNPDYHTGMGSSLVAGIKHIRQDSDGILTALADQPFIDSPTINKLIDAFGNNTEGIIIPVYKGQRGNPVILSVKYREELLQVKGDTGGREIVKNHAEDIMEIEVDCQGILRDIDTPEQYEALLKEIKLERDR